MSKTNDNHPNWTEWLAERFPDEHSRDMIHQVFGYILYAEEYRHHIIFYGEGCTGKSTAIEVLKRLAGADKTTILPYEDSPSSATCLPGKKLIHIPDITEDRLKNSNLIKSIATRTPIMVEPKFESPYTYRAKGIMVMESNHNKPFNLYSVPINNLLHQIEFAVPITNPRSDIVESITEELPAIREWAKEGYIRLVNRCTF